MISFIPVHPVQTAHKSIGDETLLECHKGSNLLTNVPLPFKYKRGLASRWSSRRTDKQASSCTARLQGRQMVCNVCGTVLPNHTINNSTTITNLYLISLSILEVA